MFLNNNQKQIFNLIIENDRYISKTRSGNYKIRELSFTHSNMKSIKHFSNSLNAIYNGVFKVFNIPHNFKRYTLIHRKMGLVDNNIELTALGEKFVDLLYHNNAELLIDIENNIKDMENKTIFQIEFYLYLSVNYLFENNKILSDINYQFIFSDRIQNISFFIENIYDLALRENDDINDHITNLFKLSTGSEIFYYLQFFNFIGYEIHRFYSLNNEERNIFIKKIKTALEDEIFHNFIKLNGEEVEYSSLSSDTRFSDDEIKYIKMLKYYKYNYQKDLRFRTKYSTLSFLLANSIRMKNNKIELYRNEKINKLLSFDIIKDYYKKFDLEKIYKLVYTKYKLDNSVVKIYKLNVSSEFNIDDNIILEEYTNDDANDFFKKNFRLNDHIIVKDMEDGIIGTWSYKIVKFEIDKEYKIIKIILDKENKLNI